MQLKRSVAVSLVTVGAIFFGGCTSSDDSRAVEQETLAEAVEESPAEAVEESPAEAVEESPADEISENITVGVTLLLSSSAVDRLGSSIQVKVSDGSGNLLGVGTFTNPPGRYGGTTTLRNVKTSPDGFYVVELAGVPGEIIYSESDVVSGRLDVVSQVG